MSLLQPKRVMEVPDYQTGLCLWQTTNGGYVMDSDQNYLNCFGKVGDPIIEMKMAEAAKSIGITGGKALWLPGFRRVTQSEWEDQMAELMEGGIPDPVDVWRQATNGK